MPKGRQPQPGQIIDGKYRLVRCLRDGGMGVVWRAMSLSDDETVAIKLIHASLVRYPTAVARFRREAEALTRARSPHVVQIRDQGVDAKLGPYIVMEHLQGEDLADHVIAGGPLSIARMLEIFAQVAVALQTAHRSGVVHRDVKPANIFLKRTWEGREEAVLVDFGVAKTGTPLTEDGRHTALGVMLGTVSSMSPEQIQGQPTDERSDVWGFAMAAFEALIGSPAVDPNQPVGQAAVQICAAPLPVPSEFNASIPRSFDTWFRKSTRRNPDDRFQSIEEQWEALAALFTEKRIVAWVDPNASSWTLEEAPLVTLTIPPLVARPLRATLPDVSATAK